MKFRHVLPLLLAGALPWSARGTVFSSSVENIFAPIPDGDFDGIQSSQTLSGIPGPIADVNVTLTISGGFNGDFYVYLFHNNGSAILLNRVGRSSTSSVGYPDGGFGPDGSSIRFTFDDQAAQDVHLYRTLGFALNASGQLTGSWQPDARAIDPLSAGSAFNGAARSSMLGLFNGMDPNGAWSLLVSDVSSGAEGTLVNWGLQITAVPEPASTLLLGLGLVLLVCRPQRRRGGRVREGKPVANLSPLPGAAMSCAELAERWPSLEKLSPDEANAFADDLERARANPPPLSPAWD